jgi:catechol-2,3-dioxygenase
MPQLLGFDHIHVYVQDRAAAEAWYARVMGLTRTPSLEFWAADGGPLTIQDADETIHIALFERAAQPTRSTVALKASAEGFAQWRKHLAAMPDVKLTVEDHSVAMSMYFSDPDGNPYEITTYEYAAAKHAG